MVTLFRAIPCNKTLATHIAVGMGAASFWRGAWYVLDDQLFPDNAAYSAGASLSLGIAGMAASQGLVARAERMGRMGRLGAIYCLATSCVLVWRGTWVGWDCLYEYYQNGKVKSTDPGHATRSGIVSHVTAVSFLVGAGLFASILAPPASVSVIRDLTVRGGGVVAGPAQKLVDSFFSKSTRSAARLGSARFSSSTGLVRSHHQSPTNTLAGYRTSFSSISARRTTTFR